jgi:hypothetical protein
MALDGSVLFVGGYILWVDLYLLALWLKGVLVVKKLISFKARIIFLIVSMCTINGINAAGGLHCFYFWIVYCYLLYKIGFDCNLLKIISMILALEYVHNR